MTLTKFGKFVLLRKIGAGGMAEVYKAKAVGMDGFERTIGLKLILPQLSSDPEFVKMFIKEAKLSALLQHKNIVQVFDLGTVGNRYFIAMEFLEGKNLVDILKSCAKAQKKLPVDIGVFIIREVANALAYAHEKKDSHGNSMNIIHRDISPSNIIVCYDGVVKLLDFGIARAALKAKDHQTVTTTFKGKFSYMAPEQVEGLPIDYRIDIFALGIVFYEALTMKRLFKGANEFDTMRRIREMKILPPSKFNPEIPKSLDQIVLKCLERDRNKRYQSARELAEALTEFVYNMRVGEEKVAKFMQELFPEREKEEVSEEQLEILTREVSGGEDSPSISKVSPEAKVVQAKEPTVSQKTFIGSIIFGVVLVTSILIYFVIQAVRTGDSNRSFEEKKLGIVKSSSKFATVTVNSFPSGAKVYINNKFTGKTTPVTLDTIQPGENIKVKLELDKFVSWERIVNLKAGDSLVLDALLTPVKIEETNVTLKFTTSPIGASIFANDQFIGKTPLEITWNKSDKPVKFVFKLDGYTTIEREVVPLRNLYIEVPLEKVQLDKRFVKKGPQAIDKISGKTKLLPEETPPTSQPKELINPFSE